MNPIQMAIKLAQQIMALLQRGRKKGGGAGGLGIDVPGAHDSLRDAVEAAFERDRSRLWLALGPLGAVTPGVLAVAKGAEAAGRSIHQSNLAVLSAQKPALVSAQKRVERALPRLRNDEATWSDVSAGAAKLPELVALLEKVSGWSGAASSGYGEMAHAQNTSAGTLSGSVGTMPGALSTVAKLNKVAMRQLLDAVKTARGTVRGAGPGIPGSFSCTLSASRALRALNTDIREHLNLETAQGAIDKLESEVESSSQQLNGKWPLG